jgi:hypothetical protein
MKKLLALASLAVATTPALAVERPYLGVDAQMMNYSFDQPAGSSTDFEVGALRVRGGSMLTRYFGLEAHLSTGVADDSQYIVPGNALTDVELQLEYGYSVVGVARLPMGRAGLFAYAGYGYISTETKYTAGVGSQSDELDGLTYGAGIDFPAFWGLNLEADYTMVHDRENLTVDAVSVGLRKYF